MKIQPKVISIKLVFTLLIALQSVGCAERLLIKATPTSLIQTPPSPAPSITFTLTETKSPRPTVTLTPVPTFTSTATSTFVPASSSIPEWSIYTHPSGVELEYPTGWIIEAESDDRTFFSNVIFNVYPRPIKYRKIADPHTWSPNEGGYVILWEKAVDVNGLQGIIFLWGQEHALKDGDATGSSINAIIYNERRELDVRLLWGASLDALKNFSPERFDNYFNNNMTLYEHMFRSIRFLDTKK